MANPIVKQALRNLILDVNVDSWDRSAAIDELINLTVEERAQPTNGLPHMAEFREHRRRGQRIATIKLIRERLGCGLSEALILCKGIEAHDSHEVEIPF